jgi:predicted MFS family arabinose efflux permease
MLSAVMFTASFSRFLWGPLQETISQSLGLSDNVVATLQGPVFAIPMAFSGMVLGAYFYRWSPRLLLGGLALLGLIGNLIGAFAGGFILLAISRALVGLSVGGATVIAYALVGQMFPRHWRGRAVTVVAIGEVCGAPVAFAAGGFALAVALPHGSWQGPLIELSLLQLPILVLLALGKKVAAPIPETHAAGVASGWRTVLEFRWVILPLLLARISVWIADGAVMVWAAPALSRHFGLDPLRIGAGIGTAFLISGIAGPVLGGPIADLCTRVGGPRLIASTLAGLAFISIAFAFFPVASTIGVAVLLLSLFLTLGYTIGTGAMTLATLSVPPQALGIFLGLSVTVGALFFVGAAPLVVSFAAGLFGGKAALPFALAIVCCVSSGMGGLILMLARDRFGGRNDIA